MKHKNFINNEALLCKTKAICSQHILKWLFIAYDNWRTTKIKSTLFASELISIFNAYSGQTLTHWWKKKFSFPLLERPEKSVNTRSCISSQIRNSSYTIRAKLFMMLFLTNWTKKYTNKYNHLRFMRVNGTLLTIAVIITPDEIKIKIKKKS